MRKIIRTDNYNGFDRRDMKEDLLLKIAMALFIALITISIGTTGWTVNQIVLANKKIHLLDLRLTAVESNRFTSRDGMEIQQQLSKISKSIPDQIPPKWFMNEVEELKKRIDRMEHQ